VDNLTKKTCIILTATLTAIITVLLCFGIQYVVPLTKEAEIKRIIDKKYVRDYDQQKIEDFSAYGLVSALGDPYTQYFDEDSYSSFMEEINASYEGIGVEVYVDPSDNLLTIVAPFEGTPSEQAGMLAGDKIIQIDDLVITGENYNEAVDYMRGKSEAGAKVTEMKISILRGQSREPIVLTVKRSKIVLNTVKFIDYNDIAYIRISGFDTPTTNDFKTALDKIDKSKTKGLVIDVRDNPGGLLSSVLDIADMLLPESTILYTQDKEGKRDTFYSDKESLNIPIVVLINGGSASASEILAGALSDNKAATLVGTKSFGKGSVQELVKLRDNKTAVKITTALYYTPSGVCIDKIGIEPGVKVELSSEASKKSLRLLSLEEDVQLQKAFEILRAK